MQQLKELEREVSALAVQVNAPSLAFVGPKQFHGLEKSVFAVELTSMVVWIGYLQWSLANGPGNVQNPILEKLYTIKLHDALMNEDGTEYEWPEADFIIGNPPFLGGKRMRTELGDAYVDRLFAAFDGRVPREADFVTYWFEKARAQIAAGTTQRAGLLATNSIRGGANREVLKRILDTGGIFMAWSDEPWILEGAAVRVSLIGFDGGDQTHKTLDGEVVTDIYSDLTSGIDVSQAVRLKENLGLAFMGTSKGGPFDIDGALAREWLPLPNPTGCDNSDVLRPWVNGMDLVRRPRDMWIIDFRDMPQDKAETYVVPFAYAEDHVRPQRMSGRDEKGKKTWWLHLRSRPEMRAALEGLDRYICTPRVARHRLFVWLHRSVLPDSATIAIAAEDDFTFGLLHSRTHEVWSLHQGSWLGKGNDPRYTPTSCFETFPFPRPGQHAREAVASWASHLDETRRTILATDSQLTMTRLYNELEELKANRDSSHRAYPLLVAHEKLDQTVATAYGWSWPLEEKDILRRLLELNQQRAAEEASAASP